MPAFPKPNPTETDPVASPAVSAHAALTTSAHGGIVSSSDSRLTNARTPTAHKSTHATGGTDVLAPSDIGAATAASVVTAQSTADGAVVLVATKAAGTKAWATATAYIQGQMVTNGGHTYTANDAHTSGATFAGDIAGHWTLLPVAASDVTGLGSAATTAASAYATAAQGTTADGAVPKSLMDAKGDLFVGTADNTVARKAVGGNRTKLSANPAKSDGLEWAGSPLWEPHWNVLLAANYDPQIATSVTSVAGGYGYGGKVYIPQDCTISNVLAYVYSAGSALTANQCQIGVFNSSGTLVGRNSDVSAAFQSTGLKTVAITAESGQSLAETAGDWVHIVALFNGTTKPQFYGFTAAVSALVNAGLAAAASRFINIGSGSMTALPSAITGNNPVGTAVGVWFGVS